MMASRPRRTGIAHLPDTSREVHVRSASFPTAKAATASLDRISELDNA